MDDLNAIRLAEYNASILEFGLESRIHNAVIELDETRFHNRFTESTPAGQTIIKKLDTLLRDLQGALTQQKSSLRSIEQKRQEKGMWEDRVHSALTMVLEFKHRAHSAFSSLTCNRLLEALVRVRRLDDSLEEYPLLVNLGSNPGRTIDAVTSLLQHMIAKDVTPSTHTFALLTEVLALHGRTPTELPLLGSKLSASVAPGSSDTTTMASVQHAYSVLRAARARDQPPNSQVTLNTLLQAGAQAGDASVVRGTLRMMRDDVHLDPWRSTAHCLLRAFAPATTGQKGMEILERVYRALQRSPSQLSTQDQLDCTTTYVQACFGRGQVRSAGQALFPLLTSIDSNLAQWYSGSLVSSTKWHNVDHSSLLRTWVMGLVQSGEVCRAYDWLDAMARTRPTELGRVLLDVTTHVVQTNNTDIWPMQRAARLLLALPPSDPWYDPLVTLLLSHRLSLAHALRSSQPRMARQEAARRPLDDAHALRSSQPTIARNQALRE